MACLRPCGKAHHVHYIPVSCSQVLCSDVVSELLNGNFVVWGCDMSSAEARRRLYDATRPLLQLSHSLSADYPSLAVLVHSEGKWRVVEEIAGKVTGSRQHALLMHVGTPASGRALHLVLMMLTLIICMPAHFRTFQGI